MRAADVGMFIFIFQIVLMTLNTISVFSVGVIDVGESSTLEQINSTINRVSGEISCASNDFSCQISLGVKQFIATFTVPLEILWMTVGKSVLIGRFLSDVLSPIDPNGSLSKMLYILDGVGVLSFSYGLLQLLSGRPFKSMR